MRPCVVELTFDGPELLAQRNPVIGDVIADVVFFLRHAEHRDFALVPACNNVEPEATSGNVVNGCHLFCGSNRVHRGHMKSREIRQFFRF